TRSGLVVPIVPNAEVFYFTVCNPYRRGIVLRLRPFNAELRHTAAIICIISCVVTGCTSVRDYVHNRFKIGPNYSRPAAPVADEWIEADNPHFKVGEADYSTWWQVFDDAVLNRLIHEAYAQNLTLREAGFRVIESQRRRSAVVGNLFPQTQQAVGDYTRVMRSQKVGGIPPGIPLGPRFLSNWRLGGQLAWELDFWGRFRRTIEAETALLDASVENYDDALVLLLSEVALTYVEIRTFEQQLEYATHNVKLQRESARIATARLMAKERDSEIDAPQANSNLAQTEAIVEEVQISLQQAKNRMAVLLGRPPQDLSSLLGDTAPIPTPPDTIHLSPPAELLRRRPDILRAEREVAAQSAEIGIAETDLYPQISITGAISMEAGQFANLLDRRAWAGTIGPQFRWNVLNYGRIQNNIAVQDALFQQLAIRYQQTVLQANEEAENALVAFIHFQKEVKLLEYGVQQSVEAVRVASAKYEAGGIDYNRLFTVQQFLVGQQDQLAAIQGGLAASLIQLYKAMGGGWQIRLQPNADLEQIDPPAPVRLAPPLVP
ncbi:MAG: efflux transporter outer membrane subunit, partial [Planctomycetales bacterium]